MTPEQYTELRARIGSQSEVAQLLDRHRSVISRREKGLSQIDVEASLALEALARKAGVFGESDEPQ